MGRIGPSARCQQGVPAIDALDEIDTLPQSDAVLAAALDAVPALVVVGDRSGRATYFNDAVCEASGYTREELAGMDVGAWVAPEDRDRALALRSAMWRGERPAPQTVRWVTKAGRRLRVRWRMSALRDEDGAVTHIVAVGVDVTEQHAAEEARRAAEERFRLAFDSAPVGMAVLRADEDAGGVFVSANRALCRMLGFRANDLVGRSVAEITPPCDLVDERGWIREWLAKGTDEVFQYEKRYLTAANETIWTSVHLTVVPGAARRRLLLAHVINITDRKRAQETALGSSVDPLTGLLAEPAFLRELRLRIVDDLPVSVVRLQLLQAADVQAVHGYAAADELVERGATHLIAQLPPDARLARTGSDQFAAFFKATGREALQAAQDAIARISAQPPVVALSDTPVSFAAGVAACDPGQHEAAEALYTSAGVALEDALRVGTSASLSGRAARELAAKRLSWQRRLRQSLDEAGFLVHGQPICRLDTGAVKFTELSLRLHDEDGRLVFPAIFLPVAESTGMIVDIDRWLLRHALDLLRRHRDQSFAIRLSAATLADRAATDAAVETLRAAPDEARRLLVEIVGAEAALPLRRAATRLRDTGCRLLLLNFGMAFGSLYHARTLPVEALKIHGSFIRELERNERDEAVLRGIAKAANVYGVATIAEFVESAEVAEMLRAIGVDYGQGFHFGRPGPVE